MTTVILTAFRPEVLVQERQDETISITLHGHAIVIPSASKGIRQAVRCLASTGAAETQLEQMVMTHDGIRGLSVWYYWRRQFQELNFLCYPIEFRRNRLATLLSASPEPVECPPALLPTDVCVLSRFAFCRLAPQPGSLLLESPLSPFSLSLHNPSRFSLIGALSTPRTVQELVNELTDDGEAVQALLAWLVVTRMVVLHQPDSPPFEETHPALPYWEFHDLLFHSRSRMGRSVSRFGGSYRFGQDNPPSPVVKPNMSNEVYALYRPDSEPATEPSPSFDSVLENRRSIRTWDDDHPLTLQQIGEFLYRSARVQQIVPSPSGDSGQALSKRPYPAGGALHELDIYLVVHHGLDLPQGLYQYNPLHHQLCKLKEYTTEIEQIVHAYPQAQVLVLITSRHPRLSWKYESIAYATTLKNTGALYQTMYLVAAAMGLAGTAVGCGDADRFARITGIDYYEETLVGEFLLGTKSASL